MEGRDDVKVFWIFTVRTNAIVKKQQGYKAYKVPKKFNSAIRFLFNRIFNNAQQNEFCTFF